jgi:transposase-like protein
MSIVSTLKKFPNQEACIAYLEQARWNGKPVCPYCNSENTNSLQKELRHHCNSCRKSFSATVGTIFHDTRLPLQKWFLAIDLILNAKKGLSSCQLARDLDVRQATAWSMGHRIRKAMKQDAGLLSGIVEMDETYVGGKPRKVAKKDDDDKGNPRGRATKKECVVGMIERGGKVKASIVEYQAEYKKAIKEKEEIINKCQQEILELRKVFGETFGLELVDPTTEFTLRTKPRVDPKQLETAILEVIDRKPNLLTKEIHQEIISSHGLQIIQETVRRKLEDLLKNDKIEKTDPSAERSVRYKIKGFIAA